MSAERPIHELADEMASACLAGHARLLSRLLTNRYEATVAPLGLTIARVLLLGAVAKHGKVTPSVLAEQLGFDPSTLSRNFKMLRSEGLIDMAHASDGGHTVVSLTPQGESLFRQANERWRVAQREAEAALGSRLSASVRAAARKLRD
ncbi:MarR family winged helix-turn-helix transcriptional regulator [Paludisphaera mucosa]|uniref:MarR family winged helix-turn-helix transcriptional regulator n=1 Tax=Paludisphaera mucosa TaxID=3030827 RepID=A0ABT6FI49_9BACT|nr:MarR family winged helix-turn-helix transcriptional regulator [Paludisphaera mucosa]MDG3007220.1 MarR family winged helix-turn-helix transcriptional regulator [Paludisphaera mucosa]